jgi:hypothetical protein
VLLTWMLSGWKAFVGFLKLIPWQVWVVLAATAAIWGYGQYKEHIGVAKTEAKYQARDKAKAREQERVDALANAKIFAAAYDAKQRLKYLEERLAEEQGANTSLLAKLMGRKNEFIPPASLSICPGIPVGYVLWRDATAAFANGGPDPASPGATVEALGRPSGLSLDEIGDLDAAQASAFRACRTWGSGWRDYAKLVKQSCATTLEALKGEP